VPCLDDNAVLELVCGTLAAAELERAQQHLDDCATCRALVAHVAAESDTADGATVSEWEHLQAGAQVGRYRISEVIGAGAMGFVLAAHDPELGRTVALKLLRVSGAAAEALRPRLLREAQALAKVSHPNVVAVHDVGSFGEHLFVALELVDGGTLTDWLCEPRSVREIVSAFRQAGEGLAAAHAAGLVHRDFKPDNVLVGKDGRVRVTDFGLALHVVDAGPTIAPIAVAGIVPRLTQTGMLVGTPGYIAPEQLEGHAADVRSDQFAFCIALFEALHGYRPFAGEDWPELRAALLAGRIERRAGGRRVPRWLEKIVVRGLRREPAERWPTMRPLLDALDRGSPITAPRVALGAGALAALGVLGVLGMRHHRETQCEAAGDAWASVWPDASAAALRARLGSTEVAATVDRAFRTYGAVWMEMTRASCKATEVAGTQSREVFVAREQCLQERRDYALALAHALLEGPPPKVDGALEVASSIPSVAECANPAPLSISPANDARRRDLQSRMAKATIDGYLTAKTDPQPFQALADEAHALGLPALESHALLLRARYDADEHTEEAALQQSALSAFAAHDDAALADAWARLAFHAGFHAGRYDDSRQWAAYAQAALDRLGGDPAREAELLLSRGFALIFEGRAEEAEAAMVRARELFVAVHGEDYWRIVVADYGAGGAELAMGRLDDALRLYRRSRELARRVGGETSQAYISATDNEANALALMGRNDEALALFDALDRSSDRTSWREEQIAWTLRAKGDFAGALAHDETATKMTEAEKQAGPRAAYAPLGVGLDLLGLGRAREALPLLESALALRATGSPPDELAQAQFAVARALRDSGGDAKRAVELAASAQALLQPLAAKYESIFRTQLREIEAWVAAAPTTSPR
jgi:tetratricopeptide (TPR) repeat protein